MRRHRAEISDSPSGSPFAKRVQTETTMTAHNPADRLSEQFSQMVTSTEMHHPDSDGDKENVENKSASKTSSTIKAATPRLYPADQTIRRRPDEKRGATVINQFNFTRFARPSVNMQPEWHRINDVIVNAFGISVEAICRTLEEQVYDKVAGQVTGLYISLMQKAIKTTDGAERSPPLATIDEFLCLKKIIEKKYITAFDQVVGSFRKQVYGVFEIPKVQVEDSEALRKEIGEKHAALIGQLSEASTSNKKLAEQRAINAGLDLVLAKLDEQIIEYQKFVHFMEEDAKASVSLLDAENGLAKVCKALKQHKDLREFEESLRNNTNIARSTAS